MLHGDWDDKVEEGITIGLTTLDSERGGQDVMIVVEAFPIVIAAKGKERGIWARHLGTANFIWKSAKSIPTW